MKKRLFGIALFACVALCLATAPVKAGEPAPKRVAFIATNMAHTYASWLAQSFEKHVKKYPYIQLTVLDSQNKMQVQMSQIENCVAQGFDYIILHPLEPDALRETVDSVIEGGIPVLMVNQSDGGSEKASNVDADPIEQGTVPAEVAKKLIPQNGKVVILLGPSGNSHSIGRRKGFQKTLLDARPDIEVLDEQIANWNKAEGMRYMEDWLQRFPKIDAVISMNDAQALGAIEATKSANRLHEMTYYGVDGLADAVLSIRDGELTATCVQNAEAQAENSLRIVDKVLRGEIEFEKTLTPGELITKDNVDKWIAIHKENGQIK